MPIKIRVSIWKINGIKFGIYRRCGALGETKTDKEKLLYEFTKIFSKPAIN